MSAVFILYLFSVCVCSLDNRLTAGTHALATDRNLESWRALREWLKTKSAQDTLQSVSHVPLPCMGAVRSCGYGTRVRKQKVWKVVCCVLKHMSMVYNLSVYELQEPLAERECQDQQRAAVAPVGQASANVDLCLERTALCSVITGV